MVTKIIKTEEEYNDACERIYTLMHSSEKQIDPESKVGAELELLSLLVERYEHDNYKLEAPTPIEAIQFRMEQMNLRQVDIAPLFGGETRVSEVLNRKRPLTLKMITLLHRYLGIPLESLIVKNSEIKLEDDKRDQLLKVKNIRDFVKASKTAVF